MEFSRIPHTKRRVLLFGVYSGVIVFGLCVYVCLCCLPSILGAIPRLPVSAGASAGVARGERSTHNFFVLFFARGTYSEAIIHMFLYCMYGMTCVKDVHTDTVQTSSIQIYMTEYCSTSTVRRQLSRFGSKISIPDNYSCLLKTRSSCRTGPKVSGNGGGGGGGGEIVARVCATLHSVHVIFCTALVRERQRGRNHGFSVGRHEERTQAIK